jgi:hypothetical protein
MVCSSFFRSSIQKRPRQRGPTKYQKEKRSHKDPGVAIRLKQAKPARRLSNCRAELTAELS